MENKKIIYAECEQNTCPVCGSMDLSYGASDDNDYGRDYPWTCENCGATGKERYCDAFDDHSDVYTAEGEPVEIRTPEKPSPEDICPVCKGELEYTGETGELKYGITNEWKCTKCHATGWAKFSEECDYVFMDEHEDVRLSDGSEWNGEEIHIPQTPVVVEDVPASPAPAKAADGWFIPVTWEMFGVVRIPFEDAPTLADAFKQIKDNPNIALPKGHYVDDSFAPSYELEQVEEVREYDIDSIVSRLNCGYNRTEEELQQCKQWLLEYQTANQRTARELDDFCFHCPGWIFEQIFGEEA